MRHRTYRDKQNRHTVTVTTVDKYCIIYLKSGKSVDPETAHHKKKTVTMCGDGC